MISSLHRPSSDMRQQLNDTIPSDAPQWVAVDIHEATPRPAGAPVAPAESLQIESPAIAAASPRPARGRNILGCLSTSLGGLLGAAPGIGGIVLGAWMDHHGKAQVHNAQNNYLTQFCLTNPYVYVGPLAECVWYWGLQINSPQVCNPADPSQCVVFDATRLNHESMLAGFGRVIALFSMFAVIGGAYIGVRAGSRCASR